MQSLPLYTERRKWRPARLNVTVIDVVPFTIVPYPSDTGPSRNSNSPGDSAGFTNAVNTTCSPTIGVWSENSPGSAIHGGLIVCTYVGEVLGVVEGVPLK